MKKNFFLHSLPFRLLVGVAFGICIGLLLNIIDESAITTAVLNVVVTSKYILGQLISFSVPLIIIGFIAPSITRLGNNASRMLGVAVSIAYASSLGAALFSALSGYLLIPHLSFSSTASHLKALPDVVFELSIPQIMPVMSALVLAIYLKQRRGYAKATYRTHNIPFVFLGAAMLWFGWFGFNAGSALKADGLAAHAFMTSSISSACALLTWMLIEVIREGKPTLVGASTGLVIGLVAITPGAGFVPVWASFIIGILVSPICYFTVILLKQKLKIDDALDAFGCHGIGGIWGGIATGLFGKTSINSVAKWDGLVFGDHRLFLAQVLSIVITIAVAIVGTLICIGIVRIFTPLRVDPKEELVGLDASQHGENAYPSFNGFD